MPHRTTSRLGTTLRGLTALMALAALTAGVPLALARVGILPAHVPSWHDITTALTSPDSGVLFLGTITVIGWAAWLSFTLSVVVEVGALLRHRQAPRIRVLGPAQRMAATLVAGVVLLLPTTGAFADAPTASAATATAPAAIQAGAAATAVPTSAAAGQQAWTGPVHQVVRGDTLWDLAQHYLGSGTRWHDIAQLNIGIRQTDGTVLTADVLDLQPGWTLHLPADGQPATPATTPGTVPTAAMATPSPAATTASPTHTVRSSTETPWGLAIRYLGDGQRWADIAALNPNLRLAADTALPQGTVITLPADASPDSPTATAGANAPKASSTTTAQPAADRTDAPTQGAGPGAGTRQVTVHQGDSLSSIAAADYGDGDKWPVIFDANRGEALPDGGRFTNPDLVYPGQQLYLPAAQNPTGGAPSAPAPVAQAPAAALPTTAPAGDGSHADNGQQHGGQETAAPSTAPTPAPADTPSAAPATPSTSPATPDNTPIPTPAAAEAVVRSHAAPTHSLAPAEVWLGAAAMAAALLGAVALRRRLQQRRVRPGRHIPLPAANVAATEQSLRATQRPGAFDLLDHSLRTLALHLTQIGRELPALEAVIVTDTRVELHLADSENPTPVRPFTAGARQGVWVCAASAALAGEDELADTGTPYPALVSLGWTAQGHLVLVDLEHIGLLRLGGDPVFARHVLQALAVELATTPLPGFLEITTLDSTAPGLEAAVPERVERTYLTRTADILTAHTAAQRRALAATGTDSLRAARLADEAGDSWTPHIVLAAHLPEGPDADRLTQAVLQQPHPAAAIITTTPGPVPDGGWTLACAGPDQTVVLPGSGLTVHLQGLADEHYTDALDILILAASNADAPAPAWITQAAQAAQDDPNDVPLPAAPARNEDDEDEAADEHEDGDGDGLPAEYAELEQEALADGPNAPGAAPAAPNPVAQEPLDEQPTHGAGGPQPATGPSLADILAETDTSSSNPHPVAVAVARPAVPAPAPAPATRLPQPSAAPDGPSVLVLGPIAIEGAAGRIDSNRIRPATELITYLALNPGVDHLAVDSALRPGQVVTKEVRNALISKARAWLGKAQDGTAHLPHIQNTPDNRYRLAPTVTCDWDHFLRFSRTGHADPGEDGTLALRRALALVRGRPFAATDPGRYAWAEPAIQGMVSEITHTAHELSTRCLETGDITGALWAARRGLLAAEENEILHRCLFRAHHAAGDLDALQASAAALTRINHELGDYDCEAETAALLQELLPRRVSVR
ncbi:nucleoid-associated protein YgaU [Kitasatospora sp. GAS204A]|uniref:LysM peptidoglycan-binding domain-containing protein n=1 Tax=unclassified Kitasatospora TaxID=2633591 RepID=UPI002474A265|nr:LysM peptidoglycan-binding domain-containing protein [Kitasatospora sp. GAS204B]MDH6122714.1 nucleoid-associated protein YgaU [Kitasatospora sp. GAS204B]